MPITRQVIHTPALPRGLPISAAVRAGDTVYVSGNLGTVTGKAELVPGGVRAEARQALEHMRGALEAAGSSLDRVVKCNVYLVEMAEFAAMNEVYREFFPKDPPARTTVGVKALALGARVEIECVALIASG
jgi:reactive intermediate/imine deaminase